MQAVVGYYGANVSRLYRVVEEVDIEVYYDASAKCSKVIKFIELIERMCNITV